MVIFLFGFAVGDFLPHDHVVPVCIRRCIDPCLLLISCVAPLLSAADYSSCHSHLAHLMMLIHVFVLVVSSFCPCDLLDRGVLALVFVCSGLCILVVVILR
jgi:hypothetical protein